MSKRFWKLIVFKWLTPQKYYFNKLMNTCEILVFTSYNIKCHGRNLYFQK